MTQETLLMLERISATMKTMSERIVDHGKRIVELHSRITALEDWRREAHLG